MQGLGHIPKALLCVEQAEDLDRGRHLLAHHGPDLGRPFRDHDLAPGCERPPAAGLSPDLSEKGRQLRGKGGCWRHARWPQRRWPSRDRAAGDPLHRDSRPRTRSAAWPRVCGRSRRPTCPGSRRSRSCMPERRSRQSLRQWWPHRARPRDWRRPRPPTRHGRSLDRAPVPCVRRAWDGRRSRQGPPAGKADPCRGRAADALDGREDHAVRHADLLVPGEADLAALRAGEGRPVPRSIRRARSRGSFGTARPGALALPWVRDWRRSSLVSMRFAMSRLRRWHSPICAHVCGRWVCFSGDSWPPINHVAGLRLRLFSDAIDRDGRRGRQSLDTGCRCSSDIVHALRGAALARAAET